MSLTGSLEIFPLAEVFRLLGRSGRSGMLLVETDGADGRIYMDGGALAIATSVDDAELRRRVDAAGLAPHDGGPVPADALTAFVREHTVESIYRITRSGHAFAFHLGQRPPLDLRQRLDVGEVMEEAARRAEQWREIERSVGRLDRPLTMRPELEAGSEVVLTASAWRILALLNGGRSVSELAELTGSTEFQVAGEVAELVAKRLVEVVDSAPADEGRDTSPGAVPSLVEGWWADDEILETDPSADEDTIETDRTGDDPEDDQAESMIGAGMGAIRRRMDRLSADTTGG